MDQNRFCTGRVALQNDDLSIRNQLIKMGRKYSFGQADPGLKLGAGADSKRFKRLGQQIGGTAIQQLLQAGDYGFILPAVGTGRMGVQDDAAAQCRGWRGKAQDKVVPPFHNDRLFAA